MKKKRSILYIMFLSQLPNKKRLTCASILILSLWTVALLSAIAIALSYGLRQKANLVFRLEEKRRLACLAESGVNKAIELFKKYKFLGYLGFGDKIINNTVDFKDMDFGQDIVSFGYSFWDDVSKSFVTHYGFLDEARKLNINAVDLSTLKRFFILLGLDDLKADEIASSIIDWRDEDNLLSGPNSAEDTYYRFLEPSYEAKDSNFEILEELLLVKGMSRDIFFQIKDYLTVYGDGRVNVNTASKIVLMSLGLSSSLVDKIILFRAGKDMISGTDDDRLFINIDDFVMRLNEILELDPLEIQQLKKVAEDYLTVDSQFFTIKVSAYPKGARSKKVITAIVNKEGKLLFWQES